MIRLFALSIALMALAGCSSDPNSRPEYGGESGLPSNCRAYIQESVVDSGFSKLIVLEIGV